VAAIILPDRWKRQPQGAVGIDWSNQLTEGLQYAVCPTIAGSFNIVDKVPSTSDTATRARGSFEFNGTNTYVKHPSGNINLASSSGVSSLVIAKTPVDANDDLICQASSTERSLEFIVETSFGALRLGSYRYEASSFQDNLWLGSTTIALNSDFIASISFPNNRVGAQPTMFLNGKKETTTNTYWTGDGSVVLSRDITTPITLGHDNAANYFIGNIYLALIWDRKLSDEKHALLHANPWQIFKKKSRILYFDAPSFPVLSSLTASYITSSGGRLTAN